MEQSAARDTKRMRGIEPQRFDDLVHGDLQLVVLPPPSTLAQAALVKRSILRFGRHTNGGGWNTDITCAIISSWLANRLSS